MKKCIDNAYAIWVSAQDTTTLNNAIARATSINEAIFISQFFTVWDQDSRIDKGSGKREVCIVEATFCKTSYLPPYSFRAIIKKWERLKLVSSTFKGVPPKKYYQCNEPRLSAYLTSLMTQEDTR